MIRTNFSAFAFFGCLFFSPVFSASNNSTNNSTKPSSFKGQPSATRPRAVEDCTGLLDTEATNLAIQLLPPLKPHPAWSETTPQTQKQSAAQAIISASATVSARANAPTAAKTLFTKPVSQTPSPTSRVSLSAVKEPVADLVAEDC